MRKFLRKVGRFAKRAYGSKAGKAIRKVTRQRYGTWSRPNVGAIASDVARLKSLINVEKKRAQLRVLDNSSLGQLNVNSGGYIIADLTPGNLINQGSGSDARTGDSVKLTGMQLRGQFYHQSATTQDIKVQIDIFALKSQIPVTVSATVVQQIYLNDLMTGLIDYNSGRDPNYFNQYTKILSRKVFIKGDSISSGIGIKDFQYFLKLDHHLRWAKNTTNLANGQMIIVFRADSGNCGATNGSNANVATNTAATGLVTNMQAVYYYVDN